MANAPRIDGVLGNVKEVHKSIVVPVAAKDGKERSIIVIILAKHILLENVTWEEVIDTSFKFGQIYIFKRFLVSFECVFA